MITDLDITKFSNEIKKNTHGFFTSKALSDVSYPKEGSDSCFAIEDSSFWFKHRKNCIIELIKLFPPINNGPIFDIGGGNGYMSKAFEQAGYSTVLVEPSESGTLNARNHRKLKHIINSTFEEANFLPESLPAISLFDVVEHIEEDLSFLKKIHSSLMPKGKLYITVPAYSWLWSSADDIGGHFKRYTCSSMKKVLEQAGFKIDFSTYFFRPLPLAIFLQRSIPYRLFNKQLDLSVEQNEKDHNLKNNTVDTILTKIFSFELNNIMYKKRMKFGGSCLISCYKT